jgi:hypothetical protein
VSLPFARLDYLYYPSQDAAGDARYFTDVLGGRLVFAIEAMGTRMAMIELSADGPRIALAEHLDGDQPILVYRVENLEAAAVELQARGWQSGRALEIPSGPCRSFTTAGGQRLAIYELSRPGVEQGFEGRRDF